MTAHRPAASESKDVADLVQIHHLLMVVGTVMEKLSRSAAAT